MPFYERSESCYNIRTRAPGALLSSVVDLPHSNARARRYGGYKLFSFSGAGHADYAPDRYVPNVRR